jgi:transposase-like protein
MRPRTTQRKSWDSKRMQEAVDAVGAAKFTPSSAARHFGVCKTTLRRQLRYDAVPKGIGRKQDIPPEIEQELVDHIS